MKGPALSGFSLEPPLPGIHEKSAKANGSDAGSETAGVEAVDSVTGDGAEADEGVGAESEASAATRDGTGEATSACACAREVSGKDAKRAASVMRRRKRYLANMEISGKRGRKWTVDVRVQRPRKGWSRRYKSSVILVIDASLSALRCVRPRMGCPRRAGQYLRSLICRVVDLRGAAGESPGREEKYP